jgi:uncharacterized protein (DUF2147 family)
MKLNTSLFVALLALLLGVGAPALASGDELAVVGVWRTAGDVGLVRIEACGEAICGRIADSPQPGEALQTDTHNPDPALRDRPMAGLLILKLTRLGPNRWGNGSIYNPNNGRNYRASVELTGDGRLRLRGCLVGPLCRTQTWTRLEGSFAER